MGSLDNRPEPIEQALRSMAAIARGIGQDVAMSPEHLEEAAAEIERLRAIVAEIGSCAWVDLCDGTHEPVGANLTREQKAMCEAAAAARQEGAK